MGTGLPVVGNDLLQSARRYCPVNNTCTGRPVKTASVITLQRAIFQRVHSTVVAHLG